MIKINHRVICITGIDTDIGKTIITGLIAKYLLDDGISVITQKISQTGCSGISEDIQKHRDIMGIELQRVDLEGITCPYIFKEPCSPHLAASLEGKEIDCEKIDRSTTILQDNYDCVLLEGVGGLSVPLNSETTLLDYLERKAYPILLVSSPRLGSINHTLSALELAKKRNLDVLGILYNRYDDENKLITQDSKKIFSQYLNRYGFADRVINVYDLKSYRENTTPLNFHSIFNS